MFDIGFLELLIVGLVALLVVGPERLPGVARTAGKWIGKGRRMIATVKLEIDKEIKAEELKEILAEQKKKMDVQEYLLEEDTKESADGSNDRNS
jgi:sec-independent protein translocase protein TatB